MKYIYNGLPKQFFKPVKYVCKNYNESDSASIDNFNMITKLFADELPDKLYEYGINTPSHNQMSVFNILYRLVNVANDVLKIVYPNRLVSIQLKDKDNLYLKFSKICKDKNIKVKEFLIVENFTQIDNSLLDNLAKDIRNKALDYEAKYSYKRVENVNLQRD